MTFKLTTKQAEVRDRKIAGPAKHVLLYGGSRSGKTALFCYVIGLRALGAPGSRHVIFRRYSVAVKQSIGLDTMPKVLGLAWPGLGAQWRDQDGFFRFPNGSEVWLAGLDDKERVDKVLGREFSTLYFNEASEIPYASYQVAQTRLAQVVETVDGRPLRLKDFVDLNPTTRAHWTYRLWRDGVNPEDESPIDRDDYTWDQVNPLDNADNLPADYIKSLQAMPERQRRRFFDGEYTGDAENALWRREMFKRVSIFPEMKRIVVAIDPAATSKTGSDLTGIVVCGLGKDGNGYVLGDETGRYQPEEWARKAVALYRLHEADRIVAEVNNGGEMVAATIRAHDATVPVRDVRATRGKSVRAEPIAALYELGKVFHAHGLSDLEDQCCAVTVGFDSNEQCGSPDRVYSLVRGMTELFEQMTRKKPAEQPRPRPRPMSDTSWMSM